MDTDSKPIDDGDSCRTVSAPKTERETVRPSLSMNHIVRQFVIAATLAFWVMIFVGTHVPGPNIGHLPKHSDKLMHFVAYAGLAFLLGLWRAAYREMRLRDYLVVFAITAVYGIADELLQLIPVLNRTCDPLDFLGDCLGILCGLGALFVLIPVYRRFIPGYETA